MNQKSALCQSLLNGEVVSIMSGFKKFGISNVPREVGRSVEREFGVIVSRTHKKSKTRYGTTCNYYEYRLNQTEYNKIGIKRMKKYIAEQKKKSA